MIMKTFFRTFVLSLTRASYYKDVLQAKPGFSIKYYLALSAMLIIITAVANIFNYAPAIKRDFAKLATEITPDFPPELVVQLEPQGVTANMPFPLVAQMPSIFRQEDAAQTNQKSSDQEPDQDPNQNKTLESPQPWPKNLLILDPNGQVSMLQEYDSLMLINNSYLIVRDGMGVETVALKDLPATRIDLARMQSLAGLARFISANAPVIISLGTFLGGLVKFFVFWLAYLFLFGFGLWLLNRGALAVFSHGFKVGIHSFTLPILISTTLGIAGVSVPIPGWFVVVHTLFALFVTRRPNHDITT